jgi:ABC-2 type transport system permease protein
MLVQSAMISILALLLGLRIYPLALVEMTAILVLIALTVAPLSYAMAMVFKRDEVLGPAVNLVAMPLLLLSGILLPMTYAPTWLRVLSLANPLTTVVEGSRELYAGHVWNSGIALAFGLATGCAAVSLALAGRLFVRAAK